MRQTLPKPKRSGSSFGRVTSESPEALISISVYLICHADSKYRSAALGLWEGLSHSASLRLIVIVLKSHSALLRLIVIVLKCHSALLVIR